MFKRYVFGVLLISITGLYAQTAISGYVNIEDTESSKEIHLTQIALEDISNYNKAKKIAIIRIDENGFFQFKRKQIADKNTIYRLYVNRFEKALKDTLQVDQLFILSNQDSIRFKKNKIPFAEYANTSLADKEWQKLRKFERKLLKVDFKKDDSLSEAYVGNMKSYAKDSLQILMVKLISIKQLDNKNLLNRDITKNSDYYVALLTELKESDIERSEYLFLENKLAFLTTDVAESKYVTSTIINILLGLLVAGLLFFVFRLRNKRNSLPISDLSRQEKNIQGLILQGKSNKEIANELFISLSTVKTHITNIYSKLQVSSRQELLRRTYN